MKLAGCDIISFMSTVIYSKKHCPQCVATYRQFDKLDIDYIIVDVEEASGHQLPDH